METVKLSPQGQIPIPKGILEAGHLVPGTEFNISLVGTEIRLRPVGKIEDVTECPARRELTGQALIDDMEAYRKKVTATPEAARSFLIRLGVMDPDGTMKTLTQ